MRMSWLIAVGFWAWPLLAADQPQWGEAWSRNMVSVEKGLPERFEPRNGVNVKWSAKLGTETYSSPIVAGGRRSEEHTSELQSPCNLVCRLLLEKKKQR